MKPKRGFRQWARKQSPFTAGTSNFTYSAKIQVYPLLGLKRLTEGNNDYLARSFQWEYTNQGRDYWLKRYQNSSLISSRDRDYFVWLYDEVKRRGYR